jgi:protein involved in polysaccharide export with SLBB domain
MQLGNSARFFKYGLIFVVPTLFAGAVAARAFQTDQSTGTSGQTACSPTDTTCQVYSDQARSASVYQQNQQPSAQTPGVQQITVPSTGENTQNQTVLNQQQQRQIKPLPLDSPTEFQLAIANSIGKMLPIYGASLFRNPPSTFAPANMVPVTPDYVIGPGDELLIQMWGQVALNGRFIVDRSGNIYIPQVGTFRVAGLHYGQLQDYLKSQVGRVYRNFDLNVNMGQLRSIQVFVVGQARQPGSYTISSLSTLTTALFATGGPTPQGSLRHIQLKRGNATVVDFDLYDLLLRGDKSKDAQLLPGDVIYISPVGAQVAVAGSVNVPGIYELKSQNETVGDILQLAAGLTSVSSSESVRLERVDDRHLRSISQISLDTQGRTTTLRDGDLLEVDAIANEYKNAVTLRGNVANPGRYLWKPGMRIRDLLPDKDSLITRDYWLKQSQLGQPGLTYIPTCPPQSAYGIPTLRYGIPVGEEGLDPNWRYSSTRNPYLTGVPFTDTERKPSVLADGTKVTDGGLECQQQPSPSQTVGPTLGPTDLYSTTSSNSGQQASNTQQALTQGGQGIQGVQGVVPPVSSETPTSQASLSIGMTSVQPVSTQFKPRFDVKLSEPDIDWNYAVIERQSKENLTTSLLSFNLGKLVLQGDASQNLELVPGDVVTIFSKADIRVPQEEQTKFVRLEGEFVSAGIYSVKPGETLRQLVERAGGLTPQAYLYGSEFTRESTRRVQQQRLDEYVDQLSLQASTNASNAASKSISAQDSSAATLMQSQIQSIIAGLRRSRSTGRIVLNLAPNSNSVGDLPDIPLEDGDRFIIPRVPTTVSVDGAVYNQNSFLYDQHRRLGDYMRLAGGANRDADKGRSYVIRAGGAVISKQYSSSLRGSGFDSVQLYPGDTVVVPLNLDKGRNLRLIVDIAQIFGQFGLAIAAANTIF